MHVYLYDVRGSSLPIGKKWSSFTKANSRGETDNYGVYELGSSTDSVHYIGEGHVKSRLLAHFADGSTPIPGTKSYRVEYTGSKVRCVQRQNALLNEFKKRYGKLPKYNQRRR